MVEAGLLDFADNAQNGTQGMPRVREMTLQLGLNDTYLEAATTEILPMVAPQMLMDGMAATLAVGIERSEEWCASYVAGTN